MLVNFFYAHPVGHAVEALHYAHGHKVAAPGLEVSVALNAATAVELARFCPFVERAYAIDHPLLEPCAESAARLAEIPRDWDGIADDPRRWQDVQLATVPGAARLLRGQRRAPRGARRALDRRQRAGSPTRPTGRCGSSCRRRVRWTSGEQWIAVMPAGSSERSLYPSLASWRLILDALAEALPGGASPCRPRGKTGGRPRSSPASTPRCSATWTSTPSTSPGRAARDRPGLRRLPRAAHRLRPRRARRRHAVAGHLRRALVRVLLQPRPVPLGHPRRRALPCFSQFAPAATIDDGEDGPRTPSMSRARIRDDLERIVAAARRAAAGSLTYEQALRDYFAALLAAHDGDAAASGRSTACTSSTSNRQKCLNLSGGFVTVGATVRGGEGQAVVRRALEPRTSRRAPSAWSRVQAYCKTFDYLAVVRRRRDP